MFIFIIHYSRKYGIAVRLNYSNTALFFSSYFISPPALMIRLPMQGSISSCMVIRQIQFFLQIFRERFEFLAHFMNSWYLFLEGNLIKVKPNYILRRFQLNFFHHRFSRRNLTLEIIVMSV